MKNTKKIISLVLAICMLASLAISASAANTVDASGGTGTSSVTLSSTADGSIGGDPAATKMSVVVPTVLPVAVGTDGTVSTATDAKIINNSFGAVKVANISIEAAQGWSLAAFGDKASLAHEKVNSNKFGFSISLGNGAAQITDGKNASKQTLLTDAIEGCYMSGAGDTSANTVAISYDAMDRMSLISAAITKAIRGDNSVHARYMVVGGQPGPEETMSLNLSPDEQRLVAQALAEQRIRLGPQAEGEEKLLRRMTGSVTEYMDAAGLSNRLDENDRALLAEHDGEQEAAPVMGGMQL